MNDIFLELPYPPTINHYYGRTRTGQVYIGRQGRSYRDHVAGIVYSHKCMKGHDIMRPYFLINQKLNLCIKIFPPDKRKRDLDNICKCVLDSLQEALFFVDDNQIDILTIQRCSIIKDGMINISICEIK